MSEQLYSSDLTDAEWERIASLLPLRKPVGKQRLVELRDILNAIFYRADNGIKWRALPKDFPAWQTAYGYYRLWVKLGVWEQINIALVEQVRSSVGRNPQPSLVIIDSQSVKHGQKWAKSKALTTSKR